MEEIATKTRRVMLTAGKSYIQQQLGDLTASTPPMAPEQPQPEVVLALAASPKEVPSPQHQAQDDILPLQEPREQQPNATQQVRHAVQSVYSVSPMSVTYHLEHLPFTTSLTAPSYDGSGDPAPWLARMERLAELCRLTEEQRVWYVAFHLTDRVERWYMRSTEEAPITEWTRFVEGVTNNFGPNRDTDSDMAPPRHVDHVNDYINKFIDYAHRINLNSEQHQVSLFVLGLRPELREAVVPFLPRSMEAAIGLARSLDAPIVIQAAPPPASAPTRQGRRHNQKERAPTPPQST